MANTNQTIVEIIKFTSSGIPDITARTKAMSGEIKEATAKGKALAGVMNDPRFARHAKLLDQIARANELIALRMRNTAAAARLADGSAVSQLRSVSQLNDKYAQIQRRTEAIAKYGERWGSIVAKYGRIGAAAGNLATGAAATGVGTVSALAARGFQNTVELNRFSAEMQMLSRELAGVFKPFLTVATKAARTARVGLERLDRGGQNRLMWGTVGTGAALWAARSAYTGGIVGRAFGVGGGALGPGAMSRLATSSAGSAAASESSWLARAGRYAGRGARAIPYLGHALLALDASTSGDYGRFRAAGKSRFASGVMSLGTSAADAFYSLNPFVEGNPIREARAAAAAKARAAAGLPAEPVPTRRAVTSPGGGWEEVGSGFERLNRSIGELAGGPDDSEEALGPLLKKLYDVLDRLELWLRDKPDLRGGS